MIWKTLGAKNVDDLKENWDKYKAVSLECSPLMHVSTDMSAVSLTARNRLDISASQWNTSPIYGKVGSAVRIEIAISIREIPGERLSRSQGD